MQPEQSCNSHGQKTASLNPKGLRCPSLQHKPSQKGEGSEDKPGGDVRQVWNGAWLWVTSQPDAPPGAW